MQPTFDFITGEVLLINKELTWTSFEVVKKIRNILKRHTKVKKLKVGHAGTLDPLASGLLIICTGKMTKKIDEFQAQKKEYIGTFAIGATTPSYDLETAINKHFPTNLIELNDIQKIAESFLGESLQIAPIYSAIKIEGERAYEKARRGEHVEMKKRPIEIFDFKTSNIRKEEELLKVDFLISCTKGTYIRSIARDFGEKLNNGAYLEKLCRTKIGEYTLENAILIDDLIKKLDNSATNI